MKHSFSLLFLLLGVPLIAGPYTDDRGVTVTIPEHPRVLALTRAFMEQLLELGVPLVGKVEEYKNRPEAVALPSVGTQESPDLEKIAALKPTVIVANTRQHLSLAQALEGLGTVVFLDPNRVEKDPLTDRLSQFGTMFGRETEATQVIARIDQLSAELRLRVARLEAKTAVFVQSPQKNLQAALPTGQYGAFLSRLGLQNILAPGLPGSGQSTWVPYDFEAILSSQPEVVLVRAAFNTAEEQAKIRQQLMKDPRWQLLLAVQKGRVFVVSSQIDIAVQGTEPALRAVAHALVP